MSDVEGGGLGLLNTHVFFSVIVKMTTVLMRSYSIELKRFAHKDDVDCRPPPHRA